jgi:hypothetical protein
MAKRTRLTTNISFRWYKQAKKYMGNLPGVLAVGIDGDKLYFVLLNNADMMVLKLLGEESICNKLSIPWTGHEHG